MKISSRAVTLAELIISSVIVSMVVAGVFAAEYALRRSDKDSSAVSQSGVQARVIAETIRAAVKNVHDDLTTVGVDIGIYIDAPDLCFRHDVDTGSGFTPERYDDDAWTCFTLDVHSLYTCEAGSYNGTCDSSDTYVGDLVVDQFTNPKILEPLVTRDAAAGTYFFDMMLVTRKDSSATADCAADPCTEDDRGTVDNPQTVLFFRQSPAGF